jgi:hypothetical protein
MRNLGTASRETKGVPGGFFRDRQKVKPTKNPID